MLRIVACCLNLENQRTITSISAPVSDSSTPCYILTNYYTKRLPYKCRCKGNTYYTFARRPL